MSNANTNAKAINEYRQQLQAMMDDIRDVDVKVLNRSLDEGLRVVKELTPVGVYKDEKTYKRDNVKKGIKAGDVVKRNGKVVYTTKKNVSFKTKDGKEVSFTANVTKKGGTLRRSWRIKGATKRSKGVQGTLYNNVEYASFVEYGHRVVNRSGQTVGWVDGKFMMKKANLRAEKAMIREFRKEIERVNNKHG